MNRRTLFNADPHCHWCGRLTHYNPIPSVRAPLFATIDHVYPRGHPDRARGSNKNVIVLACRQCNSDRNDIAMKVMRIVFARKTNRHGIRVLTGLERYQQRALTNDRSRVKKLVKRNSQTAPNMQLDHAELEALIKRFYDRRDV